MTLANLCVAYIMISDNEKAEEVRVVRLRSVTRNVRFVTHVIAAAAAR